MITEWFVVAILFTIIVISASTECIAPNGEKGTCTELENCMYLSNIANMKPLPKKDAQFLSRHQCDSINGIVFVCCLEQYQRALGPAAIMRNLLPAPGICGDATAEHIYGGLETKLYEFPWTVLIFYNRGNKSDHYCGGSLINNRYVLTAAHCISSKIKQDPLTSIFVRLGEWDTSMDRDCKFGQNNRKECALPHVDVSIEKTVVHPRFEYSPNSTIVPNDIGLIRLSRNVDFTLSIKPICLPIADSLRNAVLDGVKMDIAGWGLTENYTVSNIKLKALVGGVPFGVCKRLYDKYRVQIHETQICAGGEDGISTCRGDSGGALMSLGTANDSLIYYYLAGIISFGRNHCTGHGWPGVYTKVSHYIDWIQENMFP